jgi:hypothetical protein
VLACRSKYGLFQTLVRTGGECAANLPPLLLVDLEGPLPSHESLEALGAPLFIKLDSSFSRAVGDSKVIRAAHARGALEHLAELRGSYTKATVQGFVTGQGTGVFLLRWGDQIVARFMHLRLHESPHTGGVSSLRQSWWHAPMAADAEAKLRAVNWQGVAMVEYRWDSTTNRFALMEMNLRFWGSLHLALYAGVDFPRLLADVFFGETVREAPPKLGLVCRNTIPLEITYLLSLWRDRDVRLAKKLKAAYEAILLTLDPRVKSDLWFPGDRMLYFRRLWRFALEMVVR